MNQSPKPSAWTRVPPPLVFFAAFLIGKLLQRYCWPRGDLTAGLLVVVGAPLAIIGLLLILSAVGLFLASRTTLIPHAQPSRFVARGPYRLTRNPMYLGMVMIYIGAAAWTGTWLAIPLLTLPVLYVSRWVIPFEEAGLSAKFEQPYDDYRRCVRRWL